MPLTFLLALHLPVTAANIEVNGTCTLVDAIDAANNDDDAGGRCPPGGAGNDVLQLTADVELTAIHNTTAGANGLPVVLTNIRIDGGGREIARAPGAPDFRLFHVGSGATLRLSDVSVRGGVGTGGGFYGPAGGAVLVDYGALELSRATLTDNRAGVGGAIYGAFADVVVTASTVSGNYAVDAGGGIGTYQSGISATNSTFSGNGAGSLGGAIWGGYASALTLTHSTIAANRAAAGGGISDYGSFSIPIGVYGSVFGYNLGGDCAAYFVDDGGGNFDSDGSCNVAGALGGLDPALADNGGPTATHALLAGSPAIDAAGACGLAEDQRGLPRDAACDSGSVELGAAPVGGSSFGMSVSRVVCLNTTTSQSVTIQRPFGAWDCEGAGLTVSPGDRVRQDVIGRPDAPHVGGTAIGLGRPRVRCRNRTSGQSVQFEPAGTLTWSCLDRGLSYRRGDLLVQSFNGLVD